MRLFAEEKIENLFIRQDQLIKDHIVSFEENRLLQTQTNQLATEFCDKFKINTTFEILTENVESKVEMEDVDIRLLHPQQSMFARQSHYPMAVVYYTFQINGNQELLKYQPQTYSKWSIDADVNSRRIIIRILTQYANKDLTKQIESDVTRTIQDYIDKINQYIKEVVSECEQYNNTLIDRFKSLIANRKNEIIERNDRNYRLNPFK